MAKINNGINLASYMTQVKETQTRQNRYNREDDDDNYQGEPEIPVKKGRGRPKTAKREFVKTIYFTQEIDETLKKIKFFQNIEMKDVIYTATETYIRQHFTGQKLDKEAVEEIERICSKFKIKD